jgi:hypothetical protein
VEGSNIVQSVTATTSTTTVTATTSTYKDQQNIVLAVEEMHIDGYTKDVLADAAPTSPRAGLLSTASNAPARGVPSSQQQGADEGALDIVVDTEPSFVIDTEPVHVHTHAKPRIRTPLPIQLTDDDDDEIIVYVAPHPRRSEVNEAAKAHNTNQAPVQHTFTPYEGVRGGTSTGTIEVVSTSTAFPSLGTPRVSKRLVAPALSTPRMAKQALAKRKIVAKREKQVERRRKARLSLGAMFDKKRNGRGGGLGAIGAMTQERELRDEYGSGSDDEGVDKKWKERRRGDSDIEWGTDDEETQRKAARVKGGVDDDQYMTLPELQQVLMESVTAGRVDGGDDGQGEFTPYTPPASSKRKHRRKKSSANANAGAAAQRRKDESIAAAMEMDVDSDLDVEAMKRFDIQVRRLGIWRMRRG